MRAWRYVKNGATLVIDEAKCTGCGACLEVCPHAVLILAGGKAIIRDRALCMECGACALNCATGAVTVTAGVGCAQAIINGKLRGTAPDCGCGSGGSACCGS